MEVRPRVVEVRGYGTFIYSRKPSKTHGRWRPVPDMSGGVRHERTRMPPRVAGVRSPNACAVCPNRGAVRRSLPRMPCPRRAAAHPSRH